MDRLVSHYRLLHPLGAGGMGEVYAGVDETLRRRVALKAIRAERRLSPVSKAQFLREARVLSQLDHPHICRVYDFIEDADGEWLVMELVDGKTLQTALRAGLDPSARMHIAAQIADVLVVTHTAGIVHRDLKPGNIMLTRGDEVKVLDFGLAQSHARPGQPAPVEAAPAAVTHAEPADDPDVTSAPTWGGDTFATGWLHVKTEGGAIVGTPAYMSPEQARGEPATAASDMYSFGLLLQQIYTGQSPYPRGLGVSDLLERARSADTLSPTGAPADVAALIARLKQLAPAQRPTAVETAARLEWIRQRPTRLVRRWLVAGVVVTALLGAAKYTVDLARERTLAVAARQEADRRRTQAEDLISFMLGDLRTRLEPVGRLEILDQIGAKAMDYFATVPESALSDEELLRRSAALYQIGDVRIAQGNLDAATPPLQESLALAQALAARQPNDGARVFSLAQSHYWVGYVHWKRHDLAAAEREFESYLAEAQRLVALDASRAEWQREVAYANSNLGSVLEARGDLVAALERFRACLAIERSQLARTPTDKELQRSVASSHNTIGVVLRSSGRFAEALRELGEELAIRKTLVSAEPGNFTYRLRLSVAHTHTGSVLAAQGRTLEAIAAYARAEALLDELAIRDPANRGWQREIATGQLNLGSARLIAGHYAEAVQRLRRAVTIMQTLTAGDPTNVGWQRDLADQRRALGQALLAIGDTAAAAREAAAAVTLTGDLIGRAGGDLQAVSIAATAHAVLARVWAARGDSSRAAAEWERAHRVIPASAAASTDYRILEPLAVALLHLGRASEAAPILAKLTSMGYSSPAIRSTLATGLSLPVRIPDQGRQGR